MCGKFYIDLIAGHRNFFSVFSVGKREFFNAEFFEFRFIKKDLFCIR